MGRGIENFIIRAAIQHIEATAQYSVFWLGRINMTYGEEQLMRVFLM